MTHRPLVFGDDVLGQQARLELLRGLHEPLHRGDQKIGGRRHGCCRCCVRFFPVSFGNTGGETANEEWKLLYLHNFKFISRSPFLNLTNLNIAVLCLLLHTVLRSLPLCLQRSQVRR